METITFECETITPMFLAGADGVTPELRAPSIKGALRFWWRAMNGHLNLTELKKVEGEIFGDTGKRSKVIIRVIEPLIKTNDEFLLPHKNGGSKPKAFSIKENFKIQLSLVKNSLFSKDQLEKLFITTSILGGLGKRSRRGFGSFRITDKIIPTNVDEIINFIKKISPNFSFETNSLYPTIENIEIGKTTKKLDDIGNATHQTKKPDPDYEYKTTIGAGNPRFASPIYISLLENGLPIITTLKTIPPEKSKREDLFLPIQKYLKDKIIQ